MAYEISFCEPVSGKLAHQVMIERIRDLAIANGWTVLRFVESGDNHELILRGVGLSETEQIFIGFKTYQNVAADYYNILVGVFTGYVSGNTFETQPGAYTSGCPAHNNRIDYWMICNAQRIAFAIKIGGAIYEHVYAGKFIQYGRPTQYPYPVVCAGPLIGAAAIRYSETSHNSYFRGGESARLALRTNAAWVSPNVQPFNNATICGPSASYTQLRDTNGLYPMLPLELFNSSGVYGVLDGVNYISGFGQTTENTLNDDGSQFVVFQNVWGTSFNDYIAMELQ